MLTIRFTASSHPTQRASNRDARIRVQRRRARARFTLLPEPNPGDIFFDLEGSPNASGDGLEYLFGFVTVEDGVPKYHQYWALDGKQEKQVFEAFVEWVLNRWQQYPDMHIYHYAPYEPSALKRLMTKHATKEDDVDRLLRGEKLIDLYAVTRQAIRASVESYSIKKLEPFYGYERLQTLEVASQTLRQFERLIELGMTTDITKSQQEIVALYNQDDCVSTYQLRQWLETLRQSLVDSGVEVPRRPAADPNATDAVREMSADAKRVFDLLTFDIEDVPNGTCQESRWLLAHMLVYFRREGKCVWWEYFPHVPSRARRVATRIACSVGLEFDREVRPAIERSMPVHRYSFPAQETVLASMMTCENLQGNTIGSIEAIDIGSRTVDIRKTAKSIDLHPASVFEFPFLLHLTRCLARYSD